MSDHKSTARQIADEIGCSMATINNRAKKLGIKFKGRSPENHGNLLDALKNVKPRKKRKAAAATKAKTVKAPRKKRVAATGIAGDLNSFLSQGKAYISDLKKRISALDKEKAELQGMLDKLLVLYPEKR